MEEQNSTSSVISEKGNPTPNIKGILILLGVIIIFGSLIAWGVSRGGNNNGQKEIAQKKENVVNLAPNTVVYGYWTGSNSVVTSVDLSTGQDNTLAILPSNIKHVKVISPTQLAFINDTNERDYGKELVVHTIKGSNLVVAKADDGFGIDDYVLSPNGKYMSIWEVSPPENSTQLIGGRSRVYSIDVSNPGRKNIIYDEVSSPGQPVHYPIGITNAGDVYMDKFLPNSSAGWAYGMSMSNFTGTVKSDIVSMANGTYATQPVMSSDGTKLVFAGYDGSKGDGAGDINGFRRALVIANTIETLDLSNQTRTKLVATAAEDTYPSVRWDVSSGDILYSIVAKNSENSGSYIYQTSTNTSKKIVIADANSFPNETVQTSLEDGASLVLSIVPSDSALGNLGGKYALAADSMSVIDAAGERNKVTLAAGYVQYIGLEDAQFFPKSDIAMPGGMASKNAQGNQLQLETFTIKPTLAPIRIEQQSQPPQEAPEEVPKGKPTCSELAIQKCNALFGTNYTGADAQNMYLGTDESGIPYDYQQCYIQKNQSGLSQHDACSDSPLYLYGTEGSRVNVSVGTPIYSVNTPYNPETGFVITLGKEGKFNANGKVIESLAFEYNPAIKRLSRPSSGTVIKGANLENAIREYALKLGLNQRETQDAMIFAKGIKAPYVYLSFYDDFLSKQILPLYFSPQPDNYYNIVFYIEKLGTPIRQPVAPVFEKIVRNGFTAIEVSFIVK